MVQILNGKQLLTNKLVLSCLDTGQHSSWSQTDKVKVVMICIKQTIIWTTCMIKRKWSFSKLSSIGGGGKTRGSLCNKPP